MDETTKQQERTRILGAVKAQPNLAYDPNYIAMYSKAGGTLSNNAIPTVFDTSASPQNPASAVQQTTTSMRNTATANMLKLDNRVNTLSSANVVNSANGANGTNTVSITRDQDNGDGTRNVTYSDGTTARVEVTKNADGTESYKEMSDKEGVQYDLSTGIEDAKQRNIARVNYANSTLDSISAQSTAATKALIESIKKTYAARISLMEDTNKRLLKAKEQSGIRTGRSRYTSDTHQDVLSDEENRGLMRVEELEGKMLSLIAQAESARTDKDLEIFNKRMNELESADKDLQSTVQNLQKTAYDRLKLMQDERKLALEEEKNTLKANLDKSERAAPALVSALERFSTQEEKSQFISEYSKRTGIPVDILLGDIETESAKQNKSNLEIENIRSQMKDRARDTQIAEERLALDKKKSDFNPTSEQKAKVGKYLFTKEAREKIFNGASPTKEDVDEIMSDSQMFYYLLQFADPESSI